MPRAQRASKACERCRVTRRRCQPPHPCNACLRLGQQCVVREKARPHRLPPGVDWRVSASNAMGLAIPPSASFNTPTPESPPDIQRQLEAEGLSTLDPLEILTHLAGSAAREKLGCDMTCQLSEPPTHWKGSVAAWYSSTTDSKGPGLSLTHQKMLQMVQYMRQLSGTPLDLVDIDQIDSWVADVFRGYSATAHIQEVNLEQADVPLDGLALLFAALAFVGIAEANPGVSLALLELSTRMIQEYVGKSTLELALATFLHQACALRTGTSNESRALIVQTVRVAHDIGIHKLPGTPDKIRTARFYLTLYFTDQYCAMTHNTMPCIKSEDFDPRIFDALMQHAPELKALVHLVLLNGRVLEKLHYMPFTYDSTTHLELLIAKTCSKIAQPLLQESQKGKYFEFDYINLAYIHTLWYRIMLRVPYLLSDAHWMSSASICIRAAQMVLSIYFRTLEPAIVTVARTNLSAPHGHWNQGVFQEVAQLPPTWRQVRRIAASIFIIIYSFSYGEIAVDEAGRACAQSLALLEFQRNRWGAALDDLRRSVLSFTDACGIDVRDHLRSLLPQVTDKFIDGTLIMSESAMDDQAAQSLEPHECDPVHEAAFVSGWDLENLESVLSPLAFSELPFIGLG